MLANLLDHRDDPATPLIVPLSRTLPFTGLLGPIIAASPVEIPAEFLQVHHDLPTPRHAITGINAAITAAARDLTLFSEQGLPWATA